MEQIQRSSGNSLTKTDSNLNVFIDYSKKMWEAFDTRTIIMNTQDINFRTNVSIRRNSSDEILIIRRIGKYDLAWPIILTVLHENDLIFVESENPYIWGEGDTIEEAKQSFEDFFLYEFESYKNTPIEKMDFFAQEELKLYKVLLNIS